MKKVAIIGAGPSGLTAAHELLSRSDSYEVTIFEESNEIGGISKTVRYNGNRMDIGGHRFFSKDQSIMNWWTEMLPLQGALAKDDLVLNRQRPLVAGGPDPEKEDRVMLVRNRISRIYFNKCFFDYPLRLKLATFVNMGLWRTVSAGYSYVLASLFKRPEKSLEDFYINRFGRVLYRMFFESYTEKVWGRAPNKLAADWGAQRVRGLSIFRLLWDGIKKMVYGKQNTATETSLIEEFYYPKFGPGQMWEQVASEVSDKGGRVLMEQQVKRIRCENNKVTGISCETPEGVKEYPADIVISSMPMKDLVAGLENVSVPQEIQNIAQGLPYRDFITVGLLVNRLKIKNSTKIKTMGNIVPDCWIYIQEPGVKVGRLQLFNNWSPYMVKDPENTVWIGMEYFCTEGDALWKLSNDELIDLAVREMIAMDIIDKKDVLDAHSIKIKKAYPAYFDTYEHIDTLKTWIDGIDGLYCIGRNGQHRYNNMDHSMLTAFYCVDCLLNQDVDKKDIWKINSEEEYHETKQSN